MLLGPLGAGVPTQAGAPASDDEPEGLAAVGGWPLWASTLLVTWAPDAALATWLSADLPSSDPPSVEASFAQTFYDAPLLAHGHGNGGCDTPTSNWAPDGGARVAAAPAGLSVQAHASDQELSSDDGVGPCPVGKDGRSLPAYACRHEQCMCT